MKVKSIGAAVCVLLAAGFARGEIRALDPAPNGASWAKSWWMKRHEEKLAAAKGGADVVFLGDSITHFWETTGRAQWEKYFSGGSFKALNLGFSGDRTENVLWRIEHGEFDGYEAKVVFLLIGTNNTGHFPFAKEPPADTILGVREIVNRLRLKQPKAKIVITAIFPYGEKPDAATRRRNDAVNKEIAKFADGRNVYWLDLNHQFLAADGTLPREIFPDALHPAAFGYELWAAAALPYVAYALSGSPLPFPNTYPPVADKARFRTGGPATAWPVSRIRAEGYGGRDWWLDRLLERRRQIAASGGAFDLVFLGDSITHNWENNKGKAVLAELRKTYSILDAGYSGDTTETLLWRLENGELEGYGTKLFMLMIGTNNRQSPEDVAAGTRAILDLLRAKHPEAQVLLLGLLPRGSGAKDGASVRNGKINGIVRAWADGKTVFWCDFGDRFLDADGSLKVELMGDRLHPDHPGYLIWRDAVLPHFRRACGK